MSAYSYRPLAVGHIRLLKLLPGTDDDQIRCQLQPIDLAQKHLYECLSYTWGSSERPCAISCDDFDFPVTKSVHGALGLLRLPDEIRTLWIDQICINQDDLEERRQQVEVMHRVYQGAWRTVVYLHSDDNSDLSLQPNVRVSISDWVRLVTWFVLRGLDGMLGGSSARPPPECVTTEAMRHLVLDPWFSRAWIMQEAAMSQRLVINYRGRSLDWIFMLRGWWMACLRDDTFQDDREFRLARLTFMLHEPTNREVRLISLCKLRHQIRTSQKPLPIPQRGFLAGRKRTETSLMSLLGRGRGSQASDSRDLVFALLNLATDSFPTSTSDRIQSNSVKNEIKAVRADYTLSVSEVYRQTARFLLLSSTSLQALCYVEETSDADLPSWVPDWRQQSLFPIHEIVHPFHSEDLFEDEPLPRNLKWRLERCFRLEHRRDRADATEATNPHIRIEGGNRLYLTGSTLDTIEVLGLTWDKSVDESNACTTNNWMSVFAGDSPHVSRQPVPTPESVTSRARESTLWRFWEDLMTSGRLKTTDCMAPFKTDHAMKKQFPRSIYHRWHTSRRIYFLRVHGIGTASLVTQNWLASALPHASCGRKVANTKTGYLALVPPNTAEGDVVCFFQGGGCVPFVLRPAGENYRLIGVCYVHGFLVMENRWKGKRDQTFCIV